MLLIRPLLRANERRSHVAHVVVFFGFLSQLELQEVAHGEKGHHLAVACDRQVAATIGAYGRTQQQAPEIDGVVLITGGSADVGSIVQVRITDSHDYDLVGEIVT